MNEQIGIMEPCCIERTLPMLLRKNSGWMPWQSNGDITFAHILKALACLAASPLEITLVTPNISLPILRTLKWYHQRGWLNKLTILTAPAAGETSETGEKPDAPDAQEAPAPPVESAAVPQQPTTSIDPANEIPGLDLEVLTHTDVTDDLLVITGAKATVIVQGRLLPEVTPARYNYVTYCGNDPERIAQFTATTNAQVKVARKKMAKAKQNI